MTALSEAFEAIFSNEDLTWAAVYRPKVGAMVECRAFVKTVTASGGLLQTGSSVPRTEIRILASAVPQPVEGDKIALGVTFADGVPLHESFWETSSAYVVREATPDPQRMTWNLEVQEAGA